MALFEDVPHLERPKRTRGCESEVEIASMDVNTVVYLACASPEVVDDQETKSEEDDRSGPEDPLVLLCAPFHHSNGVAADAQGVRNAVQLALCPLENLALLAEVAEHSTSTVEEFIDLGIGGREEVLFTKSVVFAFIGAASGAKGEAVT